MGLMTGIRKGAQRVLKGVVIVLVVVMAGGLFYVGGGQIRKNSEQNVYKGPSASVNGARISDKDFNEILNQKKVELSQWGGSLSEEFLRNYALEQAINNQIIKNAQKQMKVRASSKEINDMLARFHKQNPSEEEWNSLMYQAGVRSERELKTKIREYIEYRDFMVRLAKSQKVSVSQAEVAGAYESVEASHILIMVRQNPTDQGHSDADALKLVQEIQARIAGGEDFAAIAKERSEDPGSKANGGSLGYFTRGQMDPAFEKAAFALKVGEVSGPVKSQYGYHLIKVTGRREANGKDFKEAAVDLEKQIIIQKFQSSKFEGWLQQQRDKAKIVIIDPALRGYRLKSEQKWKEAVVAYEKAIKRDRKNIESYMSLSEAYQKTNQFLKSAQLMEKARKMWPTDLRVIMSQAEAYANLKDKKNVTACLTLAAKQAADDIATQQEIKRIYDVAGMTKEATAQQALIDSLLAKQAAPAPEQAPATAPAPATQP